MAADPQNSRPSGKKLLHDPERCKRCGTRGRVIDSRRRVGYRRRRHRCGICKRTWSSYQYTIHPKRAIEAILWEIASI